MTSAYVLSIETPRAPLEVELAALKQSFTDHNRASQRMKERLYLGWQRWMNERSTSLTDYLRNAYPDFEDRHGTAFAALYTGCAIDAGFEGRYTADLEPLGWALMTGAHTLPELHAMTLKLGSLATLKALRQERSKRGAEATTTRRLPESAAEGLDGLATRLQGLPDMPVEDTERRGMLVRMLETLPAPVFEAAAQMAATGENTMGGMSAALDAHSPDGYEELKRGGCLLCDTKTGIELHHFARTADNTKRFTELVVPLCAYHHNQDGSHDRAHSLTREGFFNLWGGENEFLWAALDRYADAMQAVRKRRA